MKPLDGCHIIRVVLAPRAYSLHVAGSQSDTLMQEVSHSMVAAQRLPEERL